MSEQGTENVPVEDEDVTGHLYLAVEDEDDVEGHVQPPRGDDTEHVHSLYLM